MYSPICYDIVLYYFLIFSYIHIFAKSQREHKVGRQEFQAYQILTHLVNLTEE